MLATIGYYLVLFVGFFAVYSLVLHFVGNMFGDSEATLSQTLAAAGIISVVGLLELIHPLFKLVSFVAFIAVMMNLFDCDAFRAFMIGVITNILVTFVIAGFASSLAEKKASASELDAAEAAAVSLALENAGSDAAPSAESAPSPTPAPPVNDAKPGDVWQLQRPAVFKPQDRAKPDINAPGGAWVKVEKVHASYIFAEVRLETGQSLGSGWADIADAPKPKP